MGSLRSAIDETFLVDVRGVPDEAVKADIAELNRAINRLNAAFLARLARDLADSLRVPALWVERRGAAV